MAKVIAVRFRQGEKPYYFSAGKLNPQKGQGVIVETAKGNEYAVVEEGETEVDDKEIVAPLKPVVRIATERTRSCARRTAHAAPRQSRYANKRSASTD